MSTSTTTIDNNVPAPTAHDDMTSALTDITHSTPGHEFPGAFPPNGTEQAKGTGPGMLDTARQYIPAHEDVQSALAQVGEAVKQYVPLAEYVLQYPGSAARPRKVSLPSTETAGASPGEKTGGVGALPGAVDEEEVAKLPEERALEGSLQTAKPSGDASASVYSTQVEPSGTPQRDSIGSFTSPGGGGGVTSDNSRAGESRKTLSPPTPPAKPSQPTVQCLARTHPLGGAGATWKGVSLAEGYQRAVDRQEGGAGLEVDDPGDTVITANTSANPHSRLQPATESEPAGKPGGLEPTVTLPHDGYGAGYHPAADHPAVTDPLTPASEEQPPKGETDAGDANGQGSRFTERRTSGSGLVGGHTQAHEGDGAGESEILRSNGVGKPKFMDRVKGEAKVFVGKMGGNEEKVEEGRRMMGKGPLG